MKLLVSVVMTVYNGARYLASTIESVLDQSLQDFEFIIVDDGSTDESAGIIARYAAINPRIRVIRQANCGISRALNAGVNAASAPFIAPIDQDDVALPDRLAHEVAALEADPSLVCVGGWYKVIDGRGRYLTTFRVPAENDEIQRLILRGHAAICHPGCMVRRDAMLKVGAYRPEFDLAQDLDLYLRLGEVGRLANLQVPVLKYRLHAAASSERKCAEQRARARAACEQAWARRGIQETFEADELYRPGPSRASRHEYHLRYGWWAYNSGERRTAAIYGGKAVGLMPWHIAGWKLLARSVLGPGGGPADSSDSEADAATRAASPNPELANVACESGG